MKFLGTVLGVVVASAAIGYAFLRRASAASAPASLPPQPPVKVPSTPIPANTPPPPPAVGPDSTRVYLTPAAMIVEPKIVPWTLSDGRRIRILATPLLDASRKGGFARLTPATLETMAKARGAKLLTWSMLQDLHAHAKSLKPVILPAGPEMASRAYADREDAAIAAQLTDWDGETPVTNGWKDWLSQDAEGREPLPGLSQEGSAINGGWFDPAAPNGVAWQTPGHKHNRLHTDYSQLGRYYWDA